MIRLRFVSNSVAGSPEDYPTESLREALLGFVDANFPASADPRSNGPEKWLFAVVVERGDARFGSDKLIERFGNLATMERVRMEHRPLQHPSSAAVDFDQPHRVGW